MRTKMFIHWGPVLMRVSLIVFSGDVKWITCTNWYSSLACEGPKGEERESWLPCFVHLIPEQCNK